MSVARCDTDKEGLRGVAATQPVRPWLLARADGSAMQVRRCAWHCAMSHINAQQCEPCSPEPAADAAVAQHCGLWLRVLSGVSCSCMGGRCGCAGENTPKAGRLRLGGGDHPCTGAGCGRRWNRSLSIHPTLVVAGVGIVWRTSAHKRSPFFSPVGAGVEYHQPRRIS